MVGGWEGWGTRRRDRMRGWERDKRVSRRCTRLQYLVTASRLTLDGLAGAKRAASLTEFARRIARKKFRVGLGFNTVSLLLSRLTRTLQTLEPMLPCSTSQLQSQRRAPECQFHPLTHSCLDWALGAKKQRDWIMTACVLSYKRTRVNTTGEGDTSEKECAKFKRGE